MSVNFGEIVMIHMTYPIAHVHTDPVLLIGLGDCQSISFLFVDQKLLPGFLVVCEENGRMVVELISCDASLVEDFLTVGKRKR